MNQERKPNNETVSNALPAYLLDITLYTDPLCCWTWGFAPELGQLKRFLDGRAVWQYKMGGLIPSWAHFKDETHSVASAAQMGPVWMHAGELTNRKNNYRLWMEDPPASSYPACIAVKAMQLQSEAIGQAYFNKVQEACMRDGKNVARTTVLLEAATDLLKEGMWLDIDRFMKEYESDEAMQAFQNDLAQVQSHRINRFPTLLIRHGPDQGLVLSGFRPFADLVSAIGKGLPDFPLEPDAGSGRSQAVS